MLYGWQVEVAIKHFDFQGDETACVTVCITDSELVKDHTIKLFVLRFLTGRGGNSHMGAGFRDSN